MTAAEVLVEPRRADAPALPQPPATRGFNWWEAALLAAVIAVAVARIVATYSHISFTYDEPAHIAGGMEWLSEGRYSYEEKHPPLGRVPLALAPYFSGLRTQDRREIIDEGLAIIHARPDYSRTVALARLGQIPFVVLLAGCVWVWARRAHGVVPALVAALLITTTPTVLGHAGVATTDIPGAAMLFAALLVFQLWFERPDARNTMFLGVALAGALLSKLSSVLFLPATIGAIVGLRLAIEPRASFAEGGWVRRLRLRHAAVLALSAFVVIWSAYRFSSGSLVDPRDRPYEGVDAVLGGQGTLHDGAYALLEAPVPAFEFLLGVRELAAHSDGGHRSYLLGEVRETGWWYFFPVALAVKTPIPLLVLGVLGVAALMASPARRSWRVWAAPVAAAAILLSVMPARINIGSRHVMALYPLLAVTAAGGVAWLAARERSRFGVPFLGLMLLWHLYGTAKAHPDYLSYFNEIAGSNPERILVFSDLVMGQDQGRLVDTLHARGAAAVTLALHPNLTHEEFGRMGYPPTRRLEPYIPATGWVAADWTSLMMGSNADRRVPPDAYRWLLDFPPVARVGKTILVWQFETAPTLPAAYASNRDRWLANPEHRQIQTPETLVGWQRRDR